MKNIQTSKQRGGARPNSGRKRGKVSIDKQVQREVVLQKLEEAKGQLPLDYMLKVMLDPKADEKRRDAMAIAAAPFVHAKLAAITLQGDAEKPLHHVVNADADAFSSRIAGLAARDSEEARDGQPVH